MKVLTCSRFFPKGHPKAGQPTWFVEKILKSLGNTINTIPRHLLSIINDFAMLDDEIKYHTIRSGNRWKVGDIASLRVWADKPYRSKQIEFAQVEVKKIYEIKKEGFLLWIDGRPPPLGTMFMVARNDGLSYGGFLSWFDVHPKKNGAVFTGQIIWWSNKINY